MCILVVDEVEDRAASTRRVLDLHGHRTEAAHSGEQALDVLGREAVDVLLADLTMRRMDGLTLARLARRLKPHLHVVLVTGHTLSETRRRFVGADVAGWLQKPFESHELLAAVEVARH
jgi:CheY-like chemotaxis protein